MVNYLLVFHFEDFNRELVTWARLIIIHLSGQQTNNPAESGDCNDDDDEEQRPEHRQQEGETGEP